MANYKTIESLKINAGKRTYFFDTRETQEGGKFLKITESKRLENDEFERHHILIFEEDIYKILYALQNAAQHFPAVQKMEKINPFDETKEKNSNAYMPWTREDDISLIKLYLEGVDRKKLMEIFGRNSGAINSRISKLGLK